MINKYFRLVALVSAITMIGSIFVGCGKRAEPATTTTDTAKTEMKPAKLTWWTYSRHDMDYIKPLVDQFVKDNKYGITIDYIVQSENFRQSLDLAFQSNQAPDLFTGQDNAKYYVDKGQVEPLDKYLTTEFKARYGNNLYSEGDNGVNDIIYSLPNAGITYRLVYNNDLFKKADISQPPKSISEMVEAAKKITAVGKADKAYGFAMNLKNTQTAIERSSNVIGMRSGFKMYDYKTGKFDFKQYKPILEAFKQIAADGSMFPGYESLDIDPLRDQFSQGKIGMYLSGSWEPAVYTTQFPTTIDWKAAPVPSIDGTVKGATFISGLKWMYMSSKTENKDQVWEVFKAFNNDKVQVGYTEGGYGNSVVPSVVKVAKAPSVKGMDFFMLSKEDAKWPTHPPERTLTIEGKPFNDIFAMVIMGKADFDKEVEGLNQKYNAALDAAIKAGKEKDWKITDFDPKSLLGK